MIKLKYSYERIEGGTVMELKSFLVGVATGVAAAILVNEINNKVSPYLSANDVLNEIKAAFKLHGEIDGSWIYMKTENFNTGFMEVPVYRGGISRSSDGEVEAYEFAADARTGAIIDLKQV